MRNVESRLDSIEMPQSPVQDLPRTEWDALVVGAGPAGSLCSLRLAALGYRVLLLDKASYPRDKVCGDGLMGASLLAVENLELLDQVLAQGHAISEALLISPRRVEVRIPVRIVTLRRRILDSMLAARAVDAGVTFARGSVRSVFVREAAPPSVILEETGQSVSAKVIVLATGARVRLLRELDLLERSQPSGVAVRCYVRSPFKIDHALFSNEKALGPGYAWVLPMGQDEYNVGCGISYRFPRSQRANLLTAFKLFASQCPEVKDLFEKASLISPLQGWPLRCGLQGCRVLGPGPVLVIGEAMGSTLPFSGEGIGRALQSGEIAAQVLHEALGSSTMESLKQYPQRLQDAMGGMHRSYTVLENLVARSWITEAGARWARKSELLRYATSKGVSEELDPKKLLSLRKILKVLWRTRRPFQSKTGGPTGIPPSQSPRHPAP